MWVRTETGWLCNLDNVFSVDLTPNSPGDSGPAILALPMGGGFVRLATGHDERLEDIRNGLWRAMQENQRLYDILVKHGPPSKLKVPAVNPSKLQGLRGEG